MLVPASRFPHRPHGLPATQRHHLQHHALAHHLHDVTPGLQHGAGQPAESLQVVVALGHGAALAVRAAAAHQGHGGWGQLALRQQRGMTAWGRVTSPGELVPVAVAVLPRQQRQVVSAVPRVCLSTVPRFCQQHRVVSAVPRGVSSAAGVSSATCLSTAPLVCRQCHMSVTSATCLSTAPCVVSSVMCLSPVPHVCQQCQASVINATSLSAVPRVCQQCHVSVTTATNLSTVCVNAACLLTAQCVVNTAKYLSTVSHIC